MKISLSSPITDLPRIGPAKAKSFAKLGAFHARDLLFTFPRRYEDFSNIVPIEKLTPGAQQTVRARVTNVNTKFGFQGKRRLLRIFVEMEDDTGSLLVMWYNLRFLPQQLYKGRELFLAGTVEPNKANKASEANEATYRMRSPAFEFVDKEGDRTHTAAITPIYSETRGVSSRFIRYQVKTLLPLTQAVPEYLPRDIIKRHKLMPIQNALSAIHFPKSQEEKEAAEERLRFDELFFLQLAALVRRRSRQQAAAYPISGSPKKFIQKLPFALTGAQAGAVQEVVRDMGKPIPMNRLLQGDVGSGKSAVALVAAQVALSEGYKVLYLAPTEILARQQYKAFSRELDPSSLQATSYKLQANHELLIGALSSREKEYIKQRLTSKDPLLVVGTHALLQDDVAAENVGLVIVDEQHRFGVKQRKALTSVNGHWSKVKGSQEMIPHLLSMTATPIPRTLNLTVYGDLDVSVLDELPPGRQLIDTKVVAPANRDDAILHVLEELHAGRQGYVIAPLVEESEKLALKSAKETYKEMQKLFPGIAVGLVHGQMKSEEKESAMNNFAAGAIQLLISTAVVEVGVNIPNASVMIIEGAERFGLAQLHQFRGRIGRGEHKSTCYLLPTTEEAAHAKRLEVLASTNDGFKIAEEDLKLRGPGEVYGVAQSGFSDLKVASLLDYPTIKKARGEAERILKKDPELKKYPILQKKVAQKNQITHFE